MFDDKISNMELSEHIDNLFFSIIALCISIKTIFIFIDMQYSIPISVIIYLQDMKKTANFYYIIKQYKQPETILPS